ncbi:uncharacterized protein [Gossypium hirsutum]|uniref:Uncharacterized protein isoform X2 n=1 Tax=Gossypium hirsutum TaxID=3635 RepID=A0ABM2ZZB7_GOSHI|nr:uncharacterized protein LOC107948476 isoform X2 [Gossypium hirsutum]
MLQLWVIYLAFTLLFKPWHEIGWSPNISLTEERKTLILSLPRDERKGKWCFTSKRGQKLAITSFFMGLDKYENAKLIKYGFIEDIWYKKLLSSVDLTKDFFFSYSYNVMCSLQKNLYNNEPGSDSQWR